MLRSMLLKKKRGAGKINVYLTESGYDNYICDLIAESKRITKAYPLTPGDIATTRHIITYLNPFYDLSVPGDYELTFYTRNYLDGDENQIAEHPAPCMVRFKIEGNTNRLDRHVEWPEEGE